MQAAALNRSIRSPLPRSSSAASPRRRLHWAALAALWVLLASAALTCRAQPVAVVIDGGGVGRVFVGSGSRSLETLEMLGQGTRVQVDSVAQIVVLYLQSGAEFSFVGPGVIEVGGSQLIAVFGNPPVLRAPATGKEIRLRTQGVAQGGVVMRSVSAEATASAASASGIDIDSRRPAADAPLAKWVAYALWLDENNAAEEAKAIWRRAAAERPMDSALAKRAQ